MYDHVDVHFPIVPGLRLHAVIARLGPPVVPLNTVTTNVPGPREACHLLGRRIDEVHPIVPLYDGMGVEFAIMSYADRLSICAVADPHRAASGTSSSWRSMGISWG